MTITLQINGTTKATSIIRPLPDKVRERVIIELAEQTFTGARAGAAKHTKTGDLVRSLFNRAIPGGRAVGHDMAMAPHALFVHFRTKPHVILPRNKKALRWSTGGGGFRFAKRVNHPGYKGDPYLFDAADAAIRQFAAIATKAFTEAAK